MRNVARSFVTLLLILFAAGLILPQRAAADQDDPPGRVARLSTAEGSVSFEPAGTEDWVTAVINRPITTGDKLWSDKNSRAELHIGSASIRMDSDTGFSFLDLSDNIAQLQLTEGTLRIRVRRLERDETFEVDTPNLAFNISRPGIYRINVNEAGDTTLIDVRDGEGTVTGGGQSYDIHEGESGTFGGTDQLAADMQGLPGDDQFDNWCDERDRREDHSVSRRYVSDEAVGYEDLDDYGGWRNTEYGMVWFPHTTVVGWAPYRYGHWVYIAPWGYTWVEDEPWGYAPFHYGRWVVVGSAWGWVPCPPPVVGVAYVRPVYAPALVAWVGGPHFAVGVGVGGAGTVGWFPLGPREVYVPTYRVSRTYVTNVNITNTTVNRTVVNNYYNTTIVNKTTTVTNVTYVNQRVPGAVTATSTRVVASAQPISRNVVRIDEREVTRAPVVVRAPAVEPERQAVFGAGRPATVRPPAQIVTRQVVARTAPPPPPARFETQQAMIKQNGGQPPAISQIRQAQAQTNANARAAAQVRVVPAGKPATPQNRGGQPGMPQDRTRRQDVPVNQQPSNAQQNNPQQNQRPANQPNNPPPNASERPNNQPNAQQNRPPNNQPPANPQQNVQPNRPPNQPANAQQNNPPQNAQQNRPPANAPANQRQYNDRPPTSRPSTAENPSPNRQQMEQQHQQQLENLHKQQDQERQRVEQDQRQQRQQADQQRADDQRKQQMQQQQQKQLEDQQRRQQQDQQRLEQRQEQEHQQQRQQERSQPPQARPQTQQPPQARPQAQPEHQQPRQQQQQERQKPAEKEKPKDKDKPRG